MNRANRSGSAAHIFSVHVKIGSLSPFLAQHSCQQILRRGGVAAGGDAPEEALEAAPFGEQAGSLPAFGLLVVYFDERAHDFGLRGIIQPRGINHLAPRPRAKGSFAGRQISQTAGHTWTQARADPATNDS